MSVSDDEPPTKEELAAAAALGNRVDSLLKGEALPSVLDAEERDLAQLAGQIHASHNHVPLDAVRSASIIESALARGAGVETKSNDLATARAKRAARWPFAAGALLVAAAIALLLLRPPAEESRKAESTQVAQVMKLPTSQQSRPGDALIGQIRAEASAGAGERLDRLYGDRMAGYRALQYRKLVGER